MEEEVCESRNSKWHLKAEKDKKTIPHLETAERNADTLVLAQ
jgi:hypothetical protein